MNTDPIAIDPAAALANLRAIMKKNTQLEKENSIEQGQDASGFGGSPSYLNLWMAADEFGYVMKATTPGQFLVTDDCYDIRNKVVEPWLSSTLGAGRDHQIQGFFAHCGRALIFSPSSQANTLLDQFNSIGTDLCVVNGKKFALEKFNRQIYQRCLILGTTNPVSDSGELSETSSRNLAAHDTSLTPRSWRYIAHWSTDRMNYVNYELPDIEQAQKIIELNENNGSSRHRYGSELLVFILGKFKIYENNAQHFYSILSFHLQAMRSSRAQSFIQQRTRSKNGRRLHQRDTDQNVAGSSASTCAETTQPRNPRLIFT